MLLDLPVLEKGTFYFIKDGESDIIMEDKTKRGLEIKETSVDEKINVKADKGMIHDMDGIGHWARDAGDVCPGRKRSEDDRVERSDGRV